MDRAHRTAVTLPPNIPPPPPPRQQPAWLAPPRPPAQPWKQAPVLWWSLTGVFVLGLFISYWYVVVPIVIVGGAVAIWWGRRDYRQREYERLRRAADEAYRNAL
jgi:hypothetical protein